MTSRILDRDLDSSPSSPYRLPARGFRATEPPTPPGPRRHPSVTGSPSRQWASRPRAESPPSTSAAARLLRLLHHSGLHRLAICASAYPMAYFPIAYSGRVVILLRCQWRPVVRSEVTNRRGGLTPVLLLRDLAAWYWRSTALCWKTTNVRHCASAESFAADKLLYSAPVVSTVLAATSQRDLFRSGVAMLR